MTGLTALDRRHGRAPKNFVEHLQALAQTRPDEVWLTAAGESNGEPVERALTYAALDRRTRALAARLQQHWPPGERALIMLDNDEHYAVSLLACFYAGLIAVPVFPPESLRPQHLARLLGIAADCQAACVLTSSVFLSLMDSAKERFLQIEAIAVDTVESSLAESWRAFAPADSDVAFLQYTSGSTSAPKGVMVTHGNLMANECAIRERMEIGAQDKFVSWAPLYHDMGLIGGLLQPLYSGVPLVLASPRYFLERPVRWLQLISRHRATVSGGPDFSYRLCTERVTDAQMAGLDLACWRLAYTGAEPVRADTELAFCKRFAQVGLSAQAVYACYGLAEATLFITGGRCGDGMVANGFGPAQLAQGLAHCTSSIDGVHAQLVACGTAVPGHAIAIVEPVSHANLDPGQVGEIWAEGPSICAGYWGKPEETAATFVERDGHRWLRTGDLGFLHQDQLYVTGRIKDLIIVRGHNVYPQDIERAIETEVEAVRKGRVAAFAVSGPEGESIGVAAEVSRSLQKLVPPQTLAEALSAAVSDVAGQGLSVVVLLNPGALPKTSSGKLQRKACKAGWQERTLDAYAIWEHGKVLQGRESARQKPEALSSTEQALADLWKEVLPWPAEQAMARDTHFFTSGGNSLLAVQAALRVSERWGIEFSLRDLFDHPRLDDCAATVQARQPLTAGSALQFSPTPLSAERRAQPLALSAAQSRQWFLWQLAPRSSAYHVAAAVKLQGTHLPEETLQTAADSLSARHASLRTVFCPGADGLPYQCIQQSLPIELQVADLRGIPTGEQSLQTGERTLQWKTEPFDLEQGPLWRLAMIRLADTSQIVVLVLHHIVSDAASMQQLLDELANHCVTKLTGSALPPVEEDELQCVDYAVSHRMWLDQGEGGRQLAWWRDQLGDVHPMLALQTDRPRQPQGPYRAARHRFALPAGLLAALRRRGETHGASLFTVLLAGLQALAHRYSGLEDIRIGVPVAGRNRRGAQGLVGLLVNTLVLRNGVQSDLALDRLLAKARDVTLRAQEHQDLPFDQLVEALKPERNAGQNPLFQWLFNHVFEDYRGMERLPGATVQEHPLPEGEAQFEWVLEARERHDGEVSLAIIYAAELFEAQTMERMAGHYIALLQALADHPDQLVGEVPLLGQAEQGQLAAWGDNRQGHGAPVPVHELFERQALAQPQAPALVFGEEHLSYG
ncbi:condensation domain-containing protein, partial [Paracidovorax valerianellae]|uniref:condensation domain-containing protein n=1 Tax=Paracidovorax valerianellae TaxID=187868 RepID=UPI00230343CE